MNSRITRLIVVAVLMLGLTVVAQASMRVRLGGVTVGVGYAHYSGAYWPGAYWYDPYSYTNYWDAPCCMGPYSLYSPAFFSPLAPYYTALGLTTDHTAMGEVRLTTVRKSGAIFIDGAYAGSAKDLKKIRLAPQAYDFELRPVDGEPVHERVYVLTGKTVKIDFERPKR